MRVLITGVTGQLGSYVARRARERGLEVIGWSRGGTGSAELSGSFAVDLEDRQATLQALERSEPEGILHLAAMSRADAVFREPERARRVNVEATRVIAEWCARRSVRLVYSSTDLVFDGERGPYDESSEPAPRLAYGQTKWEGELAARGAHPAATVVRLSLLYGPGRGREPTFYDRAVEALASGEERPFFVDEFRTPLDYSTAAEVLVRLVERSEPVGLVHVGGPERLSRFAFFQRVARGMGLPAEQVRPGRMADVDFPEPRPADVSLNTSRLRKLMPDLRLPTVEEAVQGFRRG